mgnify:CR=1 FL=1
MKRLWTIVLVAMSMVNCSEEKMADCSPGLCSIEATVVDLRSLDGCDFVFELNDGTRLIPERRTYVVVPTKEADPAYHYQFENDAKVRISYNESLAMGICMAGPMVFITCITNIEK